MTAIDTLENKVIATIPIGQAAQASSRSETPCPREQALTVLQPLGVAGQVAQLVLGPAGGAPAPESRCSTRV